MFKQMIDIEHLLTPIAIEHLIQGTTRGKRTFRIVYLFGVRVAYWSTTKFR